MPKTCRRDNPWDRQEDESEQAYAAFVLYRDMGADRSIAKVAQKCSKNTSLLNRWSGRWNWVERCRCWDNQLQKEAKKAAANELKKMYQRHIKIAMQLQNVAVMSLSRTKPEDIEPKDLISFIKAATAMERESRVAEFEAVSAEVANSSDEPTTLADAINAAWKRRQENNEPEP